MKKNEKKVESYKAQRKAKEKVLNSLKAKVASNTLSEEALADAEALIAEKEAEVQAIKDLIEELNASEDDKSAELLAKITEMTAKIEEIENSLKAPKGFVMAQNFIQSNKGMQAFAEVVKNSATGTDFRKNWEAELVKNGITPNDVMLPPAILAEINDAWETTADNFLSYLDVTGLLAIKVLSDTADINANPSRAHGHKKGTEKIEQILNFTPKEIRAQIVYKYITIDRETVAFEDTAGALMRYISRELTQRILNEIMRAVLIGDGRSTGAADKISKIEAIAAAGSTYTTTITAAGAIPTIEEIASAVDAIEADGDIILCMSKQTARALTAYVAAAGGTTQYRSLEELAMELGVAKIITTRILKTTSAGDPAVVAFVGKAYKIVGDLTMQGFENFILSYNKHEYLTEVYVGGGLGVPLSAAIVNAGA